MFYIVGLGNPGEEYEKSRHNIGRMSVSSFAKGKDFSEFENDKKSKSLLSKGIVGKEKVFLVLPETFMNKSGTAISAFVKPKDPKSKKGIENVVVVYDDLDLPVGTMKISYNKGTGGHRGLESIVKALKTKEFARIRIGVSSTTASGKIKKPIGEEKVLDFILGKVKDSEMVELKKVFKKVNEALEIIITEGRERAMNIYN
jgi:PTH1 family peptidyl-tRNA hydrolase